MLGPANLAAKQYPVALKPTLGFEQQFFVSLEQSVELGTLEIKAANSGVYTANQGENLTLADSPQELLAVFDTPTNACGASNLVVHLVGTDQDGAALNGTATFAVPSYANDQTRRFPQGYAVDVVPSVAGKKFKTVTGVTVDSTVDAVASKVTLFGVPSVVTFTKVGCRTQMNYDLRVPQPVAVQCGRDLSAFIKSGEIPVGALDVTAKIPSFADGLARINGQRVTGLIKEIKEDSVDTMHVFFLGLRVTVKPSVGESVDPATLTATAMYEDCAMIVAQGA